MELNLAVCILLNDKGMFSLQFYLFIYCNHESAICIVQYLQFYPSVAATNPGNSLSLKFLRCLANEFPLANVCNTPNYTVEF